MKEIQQKLITEINKFRGKIKHGRIDVWWSSDDDELKLMIANSLCSFGSYLEGAKIYIFILTEFGNIVKEKKEKILSLFEKYDIKMNNIKIIDESKIKPKLTTIHDFETLTNHWKKSTENDFSGMITEQELIFYKNETMKMLKIHEIVHQYSNATDLILMALPNPNLNVSSCLYMSWIETMTKNFPPTLLLQDNNFLQK